MITWTCHICKRERPDAKISVHSRQLRSRDNGVELIENIRYCNDNPKCINDAVSFRLLPESDYEVIANGAN